ncbi:putative ankyrin repeat protein RF_0381 isoform X2 [Haliotis rubra]|uniref:putative ankyrin repeat protein RF_0381 isoform X2 n=1 Tax=Haliotis rubra TaxID=36100 RepID=UPI001EE5B7E4|nr:putative ankyrin repeat protein RF_0381 isoform X2 [Haliotis rubra]
MVKARQFRPQMEGAIGGLLTEGESIASTTEDQGVPSEERTVVIYMVGASKHADEVEASFRNNGRSIQRLQYDNAETFKEAINTDCSRMIVLIEEQFSKLLEDEYRICKSTLKDLVEAGKDVQLISVLDNKETHLEVKYKLPEAMRENFVHHTQIPKSTNGYVALEDDLTSAAQVGNNNRIEVKPGADNIDALQVGTSNTFSTSSDRPLSAAQVGNNNHIEVKAGADNIDTQQVGRNNTFSVSSGPSVQGIKLTIEATDGLCVQIKNHIDRNIPHINVLLKPLNARVESTDLGSVIINVTVEPGTKLGPVWLREVITKILSEDIFAKLPKGTRMEVCISASLPLTPLDVDIFGTSIEAVNRDGYTPLHCAVATKNLEIVELFAEKFGNKESNPTSCNPTDISYLTKLMVKHGADVNALNKENLTPLQVAASWQSFDVVAVLLTEGADANVVDTNGQTPLHHVFGSNQKTGAVTKTHRLKEAPRISHVGPQSVDTDKPDNDGAGEAQSSKFDILDSEGNTPLHSAVKGDFTQGAITLVKAGASVTTKDNVMDTPLHILARNTNMMNTNSETDAVMKLIECSRDINVKDNSGNTPLMVAVEMNKDISPLLKAGADVNAKNVHGDASLIIAVQRDHVKMVETLIKAGSDVNTSNSCGDTALMIAVERGCKENILAILQCGADVNAKNVHFGETALHKVAEHAMSKQAVHARRNGEEKGKTPSSPFNISQDIADIVETLLKAGADINAKDDKGKTPLMTAIEGISKQREGESNLIPQLIARGANVNAQDSVGQTPLMMAVAAGHDISPLLTTGADVNSKNKSGKTALHFVSRNRHGFDTTIIQKLIAAGADVSAQDNDGNTPLIMVVKAGHDVSPLLTAGPNVDLKKKSAFCSIA